MSVQVDSAVIGGGVVGLAIALRYYPGLADGTQQPGYTGIRPRITGPGEPVQDFTFSAPGDHGIPGMLNIVGNESPGLTSSLTIADHVVDLLA